MPTVIAGDHRIFYARHAPEAASSLPLLLLHGAGGSHLHWPPHLRRLPERVVYALDLPGHGRSTGPGLRSIDAYTEAVHRVVGELKLPAFLLAGHSMGAAVALNLALRRPAGLAGLFLVGTGARLPVAPAILDGLLSDFAATTALITDLAYGAATGDRPRQLFLRRLRETDPVVLYDDFVACNAFDVTDRLPEIDLPALIVGGEEDRLTPIRYAQALATSLPHAELHQLAGAGHMAMLEQPDAVTAHLRTFAAQCDEREGQEQATDGHR